jgi:hypothetical protein
MKHNVRHIAMFSVVLALVAMLVVSTAALAKGPDGGSGTRTQLQTRDTGQTQLQTRPQTQDRVQLHLHDGTCSTCSSSGSQVQSGSPAQNGSGNGAGDGTGPIGGGSFGPGPKGTCIDADHDGICDCQE